MIKVVIMAGGKGTRIAALANDIPKPMITVGGKPVLEQEIECLKNQGFTNIIITISHMGEIIKDYFGDGKKVSPITGKPFGVNIEYYYEEYPLGNAGALYKIKEKLSDDFLLINGDAIFNIDFNRLVLFHSQKGGMATILTHPNSHPYDSGLLVVDNNNIVQAWLTKEEHRPLYYKNIVNAGIHVLKKELFKETPEVEKVDLDRDILKPLVGTGKLISYKSTEYIKDMGTPERFYEVTKDWEKGVIKDRCLLNKQKAIFLDRDGTINQYVGFLKDINDFVLIEDVIEAIKMINASGYLAVIVTNQPVVARGEVSYDELNEIHYKMETLLGQGGAYLDGIYICPHHPDSGYEGERKELKIKCNCRKPNSGMLIQASEDLNIDLSNSWIVGDSENDIKAGIAAGTRTALIGNSYYGQDISGQSLFDIIKRILR